MYKNPKSFPNVGGQIWTWFTRTLFIAFILFFVSCGGFPTSQPLTLNAGDCSPIRLRDAKQQLDLKLNKIANPYASLFLEKPKNKSAKASSREERGCLVTLWNKRKIKGTDDFVTAVKIYEQGILKSITPIDNILLFSH